jgi:hypothetical protein
MSATATLKLHHPQPLVESCLVECCLGSTRAADGVALSGWPNRNRGSVVRRRRARHRLEQRVSGQEKRNSAFCQSWKPLFHYGLG